MVVLAEVGRPGGSHLGRAGISPATSSRYLTEAVDVLAAQAPDLHAALQRVADDGWPQVVLDGTAIDSDRSSEKTTSRQGTTIDAW